MREGGREGGREEDRERLEGCERGIWRGVLLETFHTAASSLITTQHNGFIAGSD